MAGNMLARSLHDLSAAAWFGGSLMGAVGLNGAAAEAKDPKERTRLSTIGWARWTPVQIAAFGAHAIGGIGLIAGNKGRLSGQDGAVASTVVKSTITVVGMAASLYSGILGKKVGELSQHGGEGATEPKHGAPEELAKAQQQLKILQWTLPALSAAVIVLGAQQGEMQRPKNVLSGVFNR
ncbi:hypothetical protein BJ994_000504 [Arthrobacter pigmenti]|uniref:Integral membrane protein n=1 Tax=Arthrobacter pigmenti TaxID=271432 RepID=A0A846RE74_9MICC|nr:hypothetical protein [Arthrobacter pigmenti]NJC21428.1 hypothetical protein [Arthrobacter pigmenti]